MHSLRARLLAAVLALAAAGLLLLGGITYVGQRSFLLDRLDDSGAVVASQVFDYGQSTTTDPALPAEIPLGEPFTVNVDEERYRVFAEADRFGDGIIVIAAPLN